MSNQSEGKEVTFKDLDDFYFSDSGKRVDIKRKEGWRIAGEWFSGKNPAAVINNSSVCRLVTGGGGSLVLFDSNYYVSVVSFAVLSKGNDLICCGEFNLRGIDSGGNGWDEVLSAICKQLSKDEDSAIPDARITFILPVYQRIIAFGVYSSRNFLASYFKKESEAKSTALKKSIPDAVVGSIETVREKIVEAFTAHMHDFEHVIKDIESTHNVSIHFNSREGQLECEDYSVFVDFLVEVGIDE